MLNIIKLDVNNIDEAYKIEQSSFDTPWSKVEFEKDVLKNSISHYLVAIENDEVVGYIGMWHIIDEGHITNIAVKEKYRQNGHADKLLKKLICLAEELDIKSITLEVRFSNQAAQRLYAKNGFLVEGIRKNYYKDTNEDALIMWRYL